MAICSVFLDRETLLSKLIEDTNTFAFHPPPKLTTLPTSTMYYIVYLHKISVVPTPSHVGRPTSTAHELFEGSIVQSFCCFFFEILTKCFIDYSIDKQGESMSCNIAHILFRFLTRRCVEVSKHSINKRIDIQVVFSFRVDCSGGNKSQGRLNSILFLLSLIPSSRSYSTASMSDVCLYIWSIGLYRYLCIA